MFEGTFLFGEIKKHSTNNVIFSGIHFHKDTAYER